MKALKLNALKIKYPDTQLIHWDPTQPLPAGLDPQKTILLNSTWSEIDLLNLASQGQFHSFLNTDHPHFIEDLESAIKIQKNPKGFLYNPLPSLFNGTPNTVFLLFNRKEDKKHLIKMLDSFVAQAQSKALAVNARILFEELFMNALFDAPAEGKKRGYSPKKQHNEFTLACDSSQFMISCFDPHGSLEVKKLLNRMRDIISQGTKNIINMNHTIGGAGIGCSLLFRYSASIIIAVEPGLGTRVTCLLPLKISQKNFLSLGKNIQAFTILNQGEKDE